MVSSRWYKDDPGESLLKGFAALDSSEVMVLSWEDHDALETPNLRYELVSLKIKNIIKIYCP